MGDERGTVTAFVVVTTVATLMAAGLVVDGGRLLAARREATHVAEQAARAGAQGLDPAALRSRSYDLDPATATRLAQRHLASAGASGTVEVRRDRVTVTVRRRQSLGLLRLVGLSAATVQGNGEARPVRGVTEGET